MYAIIFHLWKKRGPCILVFYVISLYYYLLLTTTHLCMKRGRFIYRNQKKRGSSSSRIFLLSTCLWMKRGRSFIRSKEEGVVFSYHLIIFLTRPVKAVVGLSASGPLRNCPTRVALNIGSTSNNWEVVSISIVSIWSYFLVHILCNSRTITAFQALFSNHYDISYLITDRKQYSI